MDTRYALEGAVPPLNGRMIYYIYVIILQV